MKNESYRSAADFLSAIAEAMHEEYKAITDAGFLLQIDDPDLADAWQIHGDMSVPAYRSSGSRASRQSKRYNPQAHAGLETWAEGYDRGGFHRIFIG